MTEPTIEEMAQACCEVAGIEVSPYVDEYEGVDGKLCFEKRIYPTGTELVEKLKAWCVKNEHSYHSGWTFVHLYTAGIKPDGAKWSVVEKDPAISSEHEAFIRAFYAAFCKEVGNE